MSLNIKNIMWHHPVMWLPWNMTWLPACFLWSRAIVGIWSVFANDTCGSVYESCLYLHKVSLLAEDPRPTYPNLGHLQLPKLCNNSHFHEWLLNKSHLFCCWGWTLKSLSLVWSCLFSGSGRWAERGDSVRTYWTERWGGSDNSRRLSCLICPND